jgi:amidase
MSDLPLLPLTVLARMIQASEASSREVVDAYLERIERLNPALNAMILVLADRARELAGEIDDRLARSVPVGPLAGVPFTAKDNLETEGVATTLGVPERRDSVPRRDATAVRRLKEAGAILLGKTNLPPWGGGLETDNELFGHTRNPYDPSRSPGGSSGGEAAAIAACLSPGGLGSDSGGSLRYPAHFCGVATIKPTAGLVPVTGLLDGIGSLSDPRSQVGPLARTVDDVALLLSLVAGPDGIDAGAPPVPLRDYRAVDLAGLRVALQVENGAMPVTSETAATIQNAAAVLERAGARLVEAALPDEGWDLTHAVWRSYGGEMSTGEFYELLRAWDGYRSTMLLWFRDYDLILRPVNATPAPPYGNTDGDTLYTGPFSLTGWPAAVVRAGTADDGLPIGAQVVAHPWRDDVALAATKAIEQTLGGWVLPEM